MAHNRTCFETKTIADFKMKNLLLILLLLAGRALAQPVIITQPTNQIVLNGSISVAASGVGLLSYQWRFNGTNLSKNFITTVAGGGSGGDGGPATSASLGYPYGVTEDVDGNIFIADAGNNQIRKVDTNGIISTVAGNGSPGYSGDDGLAVNASLNIPVQGVVDGSGNLYIADHDNNRIRKVATTGMITTVAGNGVAGYSGDGGQATNASLHFPSALTFDSVGNLYIADYLNNRIRRVDASGVITTVAGNGSTAYSGDGGQATNASLNVPNGVTFDATGNFYIADYGNSRIRKVDTNGIITTMAGNGQPFAGGDGGSATNASLQDPVYVVVDVFGRLFITDVYDGLIRQVDTSGIITTLVTGLNHPGGLFVDSSDNLFIGDAGSSRIGKVALLGSPVLNLYPATTNNAGNYDVIVSDSTGSVTSSVASLTVNVPAFISVQPQSQSVSVGSNVTLNVTAGGTVPLHYQWLSNSIAILDATNFNFTFNLAHTNPVGGFSVVVTNNYGVVTSSFATLTILVIPPGIASQPASQTVGMGSNATFNVVASGSPPFNYQWLLNGSVLNGQTNSTLFLPGLLTNQAGAYNVLITSPYGSITSKVATLTVGFPPYITQQPTNQTVLAGGRAFLSVGVVGIGPYSYQWQSNGSNLSNNIISTVAGNGVASFSGDGAQAINASMNVATGVAADLAGNIFIADQNNNRIRKVDAYGVITTVAGTGVLGFSGDGGAATNAKLTTPFAVATDSAGNLFIADQGNNRVRKMDTNGILTTFAGKSPIVSGFSGDGGPATNAVLNTPAGLFVDATGNLYIADQNNDRIRKVGTNGIITTVVGNGTETFAGDGGLATNASLRLPVSVTIDQAGNLIIADRSNSRIRKVDTNGIITTIVGNGVASYSGDGAQAINASLVAPTSVTTDVSGNLFIADASNFPLNHRIRKVDMTGIITTLAGTNVAGFTGDGGLAAKASLAFPRGLALDASGNLLIADASNNRARKIILGSPSLVFPNVAANNAGSYSVIITSPYGSVTSVVATLTVLLPPAIVTQPPSQSIGLGSNATFNVTLTGTQPLAFQWQFNGNNLTNQVSQALNLTNVQWTNAGNYQLFITNNYGSITSSVATMTVGLPPAISSAAANLILLAGTNIQLSVQATGDGLFSYQWQFNGTNLPPIITTVAGTNGSGFTGDGFAATNAKLNLPQALAFDVAGNLFIADYSNNRVCKVNTNGIITTFAGNGTAGNSGNGGQATSANLNRPAGLAFDATGNLFIAEDNNGDVRRVDTNGVITRVAGTGALGTSNDGLQATSTSFNHITGVLVDAKGNLYLNEFAHCRIRKVGTNGVVSTLAGNTVNVTGGFSGDGGPATNAQLNTPYGIALDAAGNLFIADAGNNRVRLVDTNGIITTVAGTGSASYNGDNKPATNAALAPYGIAFDSFGNLFISDNTRRIRKMDTSGNITTVAGKGAAGFTGDGGAATNASFNVNWGMAFDKAGNLFIADENNNRIREVHFAGDPTLTLPNVGTTNSGNYSVLVTSAFGSVAFSVANLSVFLRPTIQVVSQTNGQVAFTWGTTSNLIYQLQYNLDLSSTNWIDLGSPITATNNSISASDAIGSPAQRFYRVRLIQ